MAKGDSIDPLLSQGAAIINRKKVFEDDVMYTRSEVLEKLGISRMSLYRHQQQGLKRYARPGKQVGYMGKDLNEFYEWR